MVEGQEQDNYYIEETNALYPGKVIWDYSKPAEDIRPYVEAYLKEKADKSYGRRTHAIMAYRGPGASDDAAGAGGAGGHG